MFSLAWGRLPSGEKGKVNDMVMTSFCPHLLGDLPLPLWLHGASACVFLYVTVSLVPRSTHTKAVIGHDPWNKQRTYQLLSYSGSSSVFQS